MNNSLKKSHSSRFLPPESLVRRIEKRTGQSLSAMLSETLADKRKRLERENQSGLRFVRRFPVIGRGCVLGDHLVESKTLNRQLDLLIKG